MRIKFLQTRIVEDYRKGTKDEERYQAGKVYDLPEASALRWLNRNVAVRDSGDGGEGAPDNPAADAMTPAALLLAVRAEEPMEFHAFKAEAVKIFGDDTPAKKADIIAALEKLVADSGDGGEGAAA